MTGTSWLLRTEQLTKSFGGITAVDNVNFALRRAEVCGIIGPNGAGKSTFIGLLGGALAPSAGRILLDARDITLLPASERARLGLGRTYQIPRPFLDMTVAENLQVAQCSIDPFAKFTGLAKETMTLLERTGLADVAHRQARELPLLRRKRLEVARGLALRPRVLMLDEVGAGLVDDEVGELIELVHALADGTLAIIIIEHIIRIVRECCSRLVVLNQGRMYAEGTTTEILSSDEVAAIYLGTAQSKQAHQRVHVAPVSDAEPVGTNDAGRRPLRHQESPLLQLTGVTAGYGQAQALTNIDFNVSAGEVVAVLGANGAGKTTLANVIAGGVPCTAGQILFQGKDITSCAVDWRARAGIAHCMEGRRIFLTLSVEENLLVAARGVSKIERARRLARVYELFPVLGERRRNDGTALSGGQQQMLAIGRTLMSEPCLAIFDEISLGLAPVVMDRLYGALQGLRKLTLTMIVIEQDVDRALELADRACVLDHGRLVLSGTARAIRSDRRLGALYMGRGAG
jgi:ABC-type branched-subunit amino acid transport system ATPase component